MVFSFSWLVSSSAAATAAQMTSLTKDLGLEMPSTGTPNDLYQAKEEDRESIIFHTSARRGDIEITLTSPHQTKSTILPHRPCDFVNSIGFNEWPFMSVHFWGENPTGEWSLSIGFKSETGCVHLKNVKVMYYGTRTKPQSINTVPKTCSKECAKTTGCASSSPEDCDACNSYRDPVSLTCLPICPNSTIARNGYCIDQQNHLPTPTLFPFIQLVLLL